MRSIHDILDLARKIKGEPNVVSVAIAIYRRRTFRQLADLRWLGGDDEDLSRALEKSAERVAGVFAVEKDGVSFETVGNTTEEQGRAIIQGFMTVIDWRAIRRAVLG